MTTTTQPAVRYLNLDGLRLLCALAVVLFHFGYRGSLQGLYAPLLPWTAVAEAMKYGHIGVHIFFCISGFVIAYSSEGRSAPAFATARFARIYPTFFLCLSLLFLARVLWGGAVFPASFAQYLSGFAMVPQLFGQDFMSGVYWSIVTELVFYVWVFVLMLVGVFHRFTLQVIAVWLTIAAANEGFIGSGALRMGLLTEFAPFFAFGMLLQRSQAAQRLTRPVAGLMATAVALAVAVLLRETADIRTTYSIAMSDGFSVAVLLAGFAALVWAVEVKRPIVSPAMLLWAGGVSYPLYLLHEGLGQIAFVALRPQVDGTVLFAGMTVACVVLASLVWWLFDRHAVPWTRRVLNHVGAKLPAWRPAAVMKVLPQR